jgi:hypothetical protein
MRRISSVLPGCVLALSICSLLMGVSWAADKDQSDIAKRIDESAKVLNEIMATPEKAIPDKVMRDAKCIAVIPSMVKIAIGFGAPSPVPGALPLRLPSLAEAGVCNWEVRRSI